MDYHPQEYKKVSIIIINKNEGDMLRKTVDSIFESTVLSEYEIIVVDDQSIDNSADFLLSAKYGDVRLLHGHGIGIANARNQGASIAIGEYLVFCDAHIIVEDNWLDNMITEMESKNAHAICPVIIDMDQKHLPHIPNFSININQRITTDFFGCGKRFATLDSTAYLTRENLNEKIPVVTGPCFLIKSKEFKDVSGFGDFVGYGWEEEEIAIKLWTYGYKIVGTKKVKIQHWFRSFAPYTIRESEFYKNLLYLSLSHFNAERTRELLNILRYIKNIDYLYLQVLEEKKYLHNIRLNSLKRVHDDDWYFSMVNKE